MNKRFIYQEGKTQKLVHFLAEHLSVTRRKAKYMLDQRGVFVNMKRVWMASHLLRKGDVVEVSMLGGGAMNNIGGPVILYDNKSSLIVVDKPPGILTDGPRSMEEVLKKKFSADIRAVHRLDKETTGVVLFARTDEAFEKMRCLFKQSAIRKVYRVLVLGKIPTERMVIRKNVESKNAVTKLSVISSNNSASYVQCEPVTGRKHQIRVHLSGIGYPVIGEKLYCSKKILDDRLRRVPRQMIHAYKVEFESPFDGKMVRIRAPLPNDFVKTIKMLL